ncbi:hypothetical protein E4U13_000730, partial [Claviceps humidiphila]
LLAQAKLQVMTYLARLTRLGKSVKSPAALPRLLEEAFADPRDGPRATACQPVSLPVPAAVEERKPRGSSTSGDGPDRRTRPDTVNEAMFLRLAPSSALAGCFSASLSTKFQRQALSWDEQRGSLHAIGQDNLLAIHELLRALVS